MNQPVVLLGAGASKPAGVPTAVEMTGRMIEHASKASEPLIERALHVIHGALEIHMAARGQTRSCAPDIERVLDAAQQLGERNDLDLTPFVASWLPAIQALEAPSIPPSLLYYMPNYMPSLSMAEPFGMPHVARDLEELERAVRDIARIISQQPDGRLFKGLAKFMTGSLVDLVWCRTTEKLDYLAPMITFGAEHGITIGTLNYDNTIEMKALDQSVQCNTGLQDWITSGDIPRYVSVSKDIESHESLVIQEWRSDS
jgi:hypothetical protein